MNDDPDPEAIEEAARAAIEFIAAYQAEHDLSTTEALDAMTLATLEIAAMTFGDRETVIEWITDLVRRLTGSTTEH